MSINFQPSGVDSTAFTPDGLLSSGPLKTESGVLLQAASKSGDLKRGHLLARDANGKYVALDAAATTIAITTTAEVIVNNLQAAGPLIHDAVTAKPPIPGTLQVAVTADGSATVIDDLGVDNGRGIGSDTGGHYTIDYNTGRIRAVLAAAPTDTEDLKAGYKHRSALAEYAISTLSPLALPVAILAEDVTEATIKAGDVTTVVYTAGQFVASKIVGYEVGYKEYLESIGIRPV